MAAVEVPQTTSHLGISKHDRFSKKLMVSVNASGDNHNHNDQLADQVSFSPLSQKEKFGESIPKFPDSASIMEVKEGEINEEACATDTFDNSQVKVEPSSSSTLKRSIQECVEDCIGEKSHQKVTEILNKVSQLSNPEKLFLYLKLPTGNSEIPLKVNPNYPLGNRKHVTQAFTWIRTHLDEDNEVSLQKDEVYQSYKAYCSLHDIKVLSQADFGKAIKQVFPNVKPRRLGMRGHSKYCYSGLCKRKQVPVPALPDFEELKIANTISNGSYYTSPGSTTDIIDGDLTSSSSQLICEWAQKLLSKSFDSIHQLAYHLVSNCLVNECSIEAVTLVSHYSKQNPDLSNQTSILLNNSTSGNKHKDAQLILQRKIQEKEKIREQKRKITEYQANSSKNSSEKLRTKKGTTQRARHGSGTKVTANENSKKSTYVPKKISARSSSANDVISGSVVLPVKRTCIDLSKNTHVSGEYENSLVPDTALKNSTSQQGNQNGDKCIIIVPSISSMQLSNPSKAKPKYKPIQPKPKVEECIRPEDDSTNLQLSNVHQLNGTQTGVDHGVNPVDKSGTARPRLKRPSGSNINEDDTHKKANVSSFDDNRPDMQQTANFQQKVNFPANEGIFNQDAPDDSKLSQLRRILESNYTSLNQNHRYSNNGQTELPYNEGSERSILKRFLKPDDIESAHQIEFKMENQHLHNSSFQFTPISNKMMPASESLCSTAQSSLASSPITNNYNSNQPSTNLFGPQTNDSPFVSPRETPLSRSRHNSGQANTRPLTSNYSSDGSNCSPFASPLGTPVHARSRHGSGAQASVLRFSASTNNRFPVALPSVREITNLSQPELAYTRSRHMSGNTLSPLSKSAPMSPMYSQFSNSQPDLTQESYQKHVNNDVAYQTFPTQISVPQVHSDTSQELKMYLQKTPTILPATGNPRCQSVPLCQMINENFNQMSNQNIQGHNTLAFSKSYPATPSENQEFNFSTETEQLEHYFADTQNDYTAASKDTLLQMPYSENPVQTLPAMTSFPDALVDIASTENYDQSNQLLFDSQNSGLVDCPQQQQNESAYNEVLQGLEENFSLTSQLDDFIAM